VLVISTTSNKHGTNFKLSTVEFKFNCGNPVLCVYCTINTITLVRSNTTHASFIIIYIVFTFTISLLFQPDDGPLVRLKHVPLVKAF
jgi:hypothetical protein